MYSLPMRSASHTEVIDCGHQGCNCVCAVTWRELAGPRRCVRVMEPLADYAGQGQRCLEPSLSEQMSLWVQTFPRPRTANSTSLMTRRTKIHSNITCSSVVVKSARQQGHCWAGSSVNGPALSLVLNRQFRIEWIAQPSQDTGRS